MIRRSLRCLPAILPLVLAACSNAGGYPSLALRDFEHGNGRVCGTAKPAAPAPEPEAPPLPPASADLRSRLDGLVSAARQADRQFKAQQGTAESAVARGAGTATASDSWASAQIALGKLETVRNAAVAALAELDSLYAEARNSAPDEISPSAEAIAEARSQVSELVARQDGVIAALSARLRS
ncbi:MAG TPA: hypothetical protein VJQ77_03495 [Novosphingobium sp.]|nr:hypothetical protein [Novosphingobium sp.]